MAFTSIRQLIASAGETDTSMVFGTEDLEGVPEALAVLAGHIPGTIFNASGVRAAGDELWMDFNVTLPYGASEPLVARISCGIFRYPVPDHMFRCAARYDARIPAVAPVNADISMHLAGIRLDNHWKLVRQHAFTEVRRLTFLKAGIDLEEYAAMPEEDPDWADEPDFQ
jgi:hypothetical protein